MRKAIVEKYMLSAFSKCKSQRLEMVNSQAPLRLFKNPTEKPEKIHQAAVIPIHLKQKVLEGLEEYCALGVI